MTASGHFRPIPAALVTSGIPPFATSITDIDSADLTIERQSISAPPCSSDINLLGYRHSVIYLDAQVSYGALDLGVAEEKLNST